MVATPDGPDRDRVLPGLDASGVLRRLGERHESLAVVESLTGGLLAAAVVDVPGASAVFRGGVVVYATDLKASLGGVPADLLAARGPVDPEVAGALARGGRDRTGADWCLATTGVAGPAGAAAPDGGTIPPGTVFVALAGRERCEVRLLRLAGGRAVVRLGAAGAALELLREHLR
jgi:nicotinamide-nucleotide amidase